jgi:hypothetical protein
MGCGCKNKTKQTTQNNDTLSTSSTKTNNPSIQESIRKVVEKYYKK